MKELALTTIRYILAIVLGWLGMELTPEQSLELQMAIWAMISVIAKIWLKPLFYKIGERQPGDTVSGSLPKAGD